MQLGDLSTKNGQCTNGSDGRRYTNKEWYASYSDGPGESESLNGALRVIEKVYSNGAYLLITMDDEQIIPPTLDS